MKCNNKHDCQLRRWTQLQSLAAVISTTVLQPVTAWIAAYMYHWRSSKKLVKELAQFKHPLPPDAITTHPITQTVTMILVLLPNALIRSSMNLSFSLIPVEFCMVWLQQQDKDNASRCSSYDRKLLFIVKIMLSSLRQSIQYFSDPFLFRCFACQVTCYSNSSSNTMFVSEQYKIHVSVNAILSRLSSGMLQQNPVGCTIIYNVIVPMAAWMCGSESSFTWVTGKIQPDSDNKTGAPSFPTYFYASTNICTVWKIWGKCHYSE